MLNSTPLRDTSPASETEAVEAIVASGPNGALWVAGLATAIVIGLWLAFYFMVFVPRGAVP